MNGTMRLARAPVPGWTPPLGSAALERLLRKVRDWEPVDWHGVFDDLASVLGDDFGHHAQAHVPDHDQTARLAQRFRGALMQLVNRALHDDVPVRHPDAADLIRQARDARSQDLPGDPWQALCALRRMGWLTLNLFERLEEVGCIQDVAQC